MKNFDDKIRRFSLDIRIALILRHALMLLVAWCFLWGLSVLLLRVAADMDRLYLLWGFAGIVPIVVLSVILAGRLVPTPVAIRAALDRRNGCGGLLMACGETQVGRWDQSLSVSQLPRVSWHGRKWWMLSAAAIAFVVFAFAVPVGFAGFMGRQKLDVDRETENLAAQIETLEEERIIKGETADELREKLHKIRDQALGQDPVKTWESLDHIEQEVSRTAQEAAEKCLNQTDQIAKAETLTKGLQKDANKLDAEQLAESMKELAEMVKKAGEESEALEKLSEDICEDCKNGSLSPEQLEQLAEALSQCKGELAETLEKMCQAGLLDAEALEQCENAGQCDCEGLIDFLNENQDAGDIAELVELFRRDKPGKPGKGGITRGRGDAEMTWKDESDPTGTKFKEQVLPPAALSALKKSKLVGVSIADPTKSGAPTATKSGALKGASTGGGSAHTHTILPRHRDAVKRYFERQATEKKQATGNRE